MSRFLTFPEHDQEARGRDCDSLRDVLLFQLEVHLVRLEREKNQGSKEVHSQWSEDYSRALLQHGIRAAHLELELIPASALRGLAADPDLLKTLALRVREEANNSFFDGIETAAPDRFRSPLRLSSLMNQLRLLLRQSAQPPLETLPLIRYDEDSRVTHCRREPQPGSTTLSYRVPVYGPCTLSMLWQDRCWGKLRAKRTSSTQTKIEGTTGIFLEQGIEEDLQVRAAAQTEQGGIEANQLVVRAVENGLSIRVVIGHASGERE